MEEELTGAVLYAECDRFLKLIPLIFATTLEASIFTSFSWMNKLTLNSFFPLCPILFLNKARG